MDAEEYIAKHWIPRRVWTHLEWPRHQDRLRACSSFVAGAPGIQATSRFLDVGCACGHSTSIMAFFAGIGSWAGVDFSQQAIAIARRLFPAFDFFYLREPALLPSIGRFDGVVCSEVIEHVEDDAGLAAALCAAAGRRLFVTTPRARVSDPGHRRVYTAATLSALFAPIPHSVRVAGNFLYLEGER